jgi:hypothetical protein
MWRSCKFSGMTSAESGLPGLPGTTPAAVNQASVAAPGTSARLRVAVPSVADRVASELRLQLAEGLLLPGARLT